MKFGEVEVVPSKSPSKEHVARKDSTYGCTKNPPTQTTIVVYVSLLINRRHLGMSL